MSCTSRWRAQARQAIDLAVDLARRDGVTDPRELVRAADLAYPFGLRGHHPFRIWQDELKQLRERFRLDALEGDMRKVAESMKSGEDHGATD